MSTYPGLASFLCARDVVPMISSWDAWVKGKTASFGVATNMINDPGAPTSITTTYGYRAPLRADGVTPYPDNWYLKGSSLGNAAEQATFDEQLSIGGEVGAPRGILIYPKRTDISVGPVPDESDIYDASVARYLASPNKHLEQFWVVWQSNWAAYDGNSPGTWGNYTAQVNTVVSLCLDQDYLRLTDQGIANRPVIGLYEPNNATDWHLNLARVTTLSNAITAAGMGTPIYVYMNDNATNSNTIGCQYSTGYLDALTVAHHAFSDIIANVKASDVLSGLLAQRCYWMIHSRDDRPRGLGWADLPLYTEIEQLIRDRFAVARSARGISRLALLHTYNFDEIDESGEMFASAQSLTRSVNSPPRGPYLDAAKNVRNKTFPSTPVDEYEAWSFHADVGASLPAGWAIVQNLTGPSGGTTGAREYSELQNSTTTNARTWTFKGTRAVALGGLGAGLGTTRFIVDGGANNDVNQDDGGARRYHQPIFDTGVLANGTHTLSVARVAGLSAFDAVRAARQR